MNRVISFFMENIIPHTPYEDRKMIKMYHLTFLERGIFTILCYKNILINLIIRFINVSSFR